MQLKVMDAPWNLIGTKEVVINTDSKDFKEKDVVKIWNGDKITAAIIQKIDQSNKNTIRLEKNLRDNLSVEIGDTIQVEKPEIINDAEHVEVSVSSGIKLSATKIKDLLERSIVCENNKEHFLENGVVIYISKTTPKGIVRVVQSTEIKTVLMSEKIKNISNTNNKSFDISTERPSEDYNDVGGLENVKKLLIENIVYSIRKADIYKKIGYKPIKGIMLYGPPGTGKTLIAKATAAESEANFIFVPSSKLKNMYYGESERKLREVFIKAKEHTPCILFFDEIDAIAEERADWKISIVNQLLVLMDEIAHLDIFVIGATNMVHLIDRALLRPGRFVPIEIPPPDKTAREQIFKVHLKNNIIDNVEFDELAQASDGLTGAQIGDICNRAKMEAMQEMNFSPESKLEMKHLRRAMKYYTNTKMNSTMYG